MCFPGMVFYALRYCRLYIILDVDCISHIVVSRRFFDFCLQGRVGSAFPATFGGLLINMYYN